MNITVVLKQVPDLVEELEVDDSGIRLDVEMLKMKLNEFDDHALEEALLLKEISGAHVTALAVDGEDVDRLLFTALAKGADQAVKLTGVDPHGDNHSLGAAFAAVIGEMSPDLVLTGVQAPGDLDGQLAPIIAARLDWPALTVVVGVEGTTECFTVHKEYAGGRIAEFEVTPPAVLGIQAARKAPRYASVSKVRQMQQSAEISEKAASSQRGAGLTVTSMHPPDRGEGAKMLKDVAEIIQILKDRGVV